MKIRRGGLADLEQRVLDGDVRAMRALVRQAVGANTLDLSTREHEVRVAPNGTGGTRLLFTGYASVTEEPFTMWDWLGDYTEIVRTGAFKKTLSESPDVIFCLNHDWASAPMARTGPGTLRISEDSTGLATEADLDGQRADVYAVQSCMEAGELDAMSFAFYVTRQTWSPDYDQRDILELDMDGGDTSVVTRPANPATTGTTALRAQAGRALARSRVPGLIVARARTERREGKTLSASTTETLQEVLDLIAAADVGLDSAQPLLAELIGVPNPDDDDESDTEGDSSGTAADEQQSSSHAEADVLSAQRERLRLRALAAR